MSVESNFAFALVLHYCAPWLVGKVRTIFSTNGKANQNQSCLARTCFPLLDAGYMYLLRILIGSLCCLHLLRFASVITLVLVLRWPIENRSKLIHLGLVMSTGDTPDPYVELVIPTAPNGKRKTKVKNNTKNPKWNEVFQFCLDPAVKNHLGKLRRLMKVNWHVILYRRAIWCAIIVYFAFEFPACRHFWFYDVIRLPLLSVSGSSFVWNNWATVLRHSTWRRPGNLKVRMSDNQILFCPMFSNKM